MNAEQRRLEEARDGHSLNGCTTRSGTVFASRSAVAREELGMTSEYNALGALPLAWLAVMMVLATDRVPLRGQGQPPLPARLDSYIKTDVKLTPEQQKQLLAGQPVTKLLETDPAKEVAIFGIVWVKAPMDRYIAAVKDIESFEKGDNFLVTKRISSPPRLEDFDKLTLPPDDIEDLKTCKVGECELKLGETALKRIQKETDWSKPTATADVERSIRKLALEYVDGYLEGGNSRLATYRDAKRPTFVAQEFAAMVDRMPSLTEYLPDLRRYLLEYPKATLPNAESFLYWQDAKFGLKPTIRINHLTIADEKTHVAVVSKMLYSSHYFWTAIELRVLVPDPARGEGFWFANVNRSRSDGLGGFVGSMIRGKVRGEAEKGMQAALKVTKTRMEQ
jgi:hypothetical protein